MLEQPQNIEFLHGLAELHSVFSKTEYGQNLAENVRFEKYKCSETTNEQSISLLGSDVNNLQHMPLTVGLTRDMIGQLNYRNPLSDFDPQTNPNDVRSIEVSEPEAQLLCLAAMIHDWGESIWGDTTYDQVSANRAIEEETVSEIIRVLPLADDQEFLMQLAAAKDIAFNDSTKLGRIFNTVERVGYLRTALRATEHAQNDSLPHNSEGLVWLTENVIGNQLTELITRATEYPPVFSYLTVMNGAIRSAINLVKQHPQVFGYYSSPQEQAKKQLQFDDAELSFKRWLNTEPHRS
jgi:hypothetical protein